MDKRGFWVVVFFFPHIARLYRGQVEEGEKEKAKKEKRATLLLSGVFCVSFSSFRPVSDVVVCADIRVCLSTGGCITRRRATAASTVANTSRKACGCGCTCCLTQVLSRPMSRRGAAALDGLSHAPVLPFSSPHSTLRQLAPLPILFIFRV